MPVNDLVRQRLQPLTSLVTSNRIALYCLLSVLLLVGTIANACRNYSNFYSVTIYLSKSSRSVLVLANTGVLLALGSGRLLQQVFFGPLQAREVERLYDQTWIFVTESLLAFTIFRDDFDIPFVIMFGFLLFVKCFHWLMADRVETMDQVTYPGPPLLFHIRINTLFVLLWAVDIVMFAFAVESTLNHGVNGMVLFASEYAILMASALNSMARYGLSIVDYRRARARGGENAPPMENKSMYIFYIELFTDFLKLITYLTFFMLIMTFYGLPLNIIRDVYLTARSFITRVRALVRYHNATRDMDRRYPDATEAELSEMSDRTCIICREEMYTRNAQPPAGEENAEGQAPTYADGPNMTAKKLPCGHIFHFQCLRSWLERQQSCPTCRRTVLETNDQNQNQGQARGRQAGARPAAPQAAAPPQGGQAPAGIAMGWLNNFLGVPPPGAAAQGQFANMQGAPQGPALGQLPPQNLPWPPAQPPLYYQLPPQPNLPPPQPVPPFRGFYGPGGAWHPWGVDLRWIGNGQQQPAPPQGPVQPANPPSNQPAGATPDHRPASQLDPARADAPLPTPTTNPTASDAGQPSPSTPREAVAQATLRRLGLAPPNPTSFDTSTSQASPSAAASATPTVPAADASSGQGAFLNPALRPPFAPTSSIDVRAIWPPRSIAPQCPGPVTACRFTILGANSSGRHPGRALLGVCTCAYAARPAAGDTDG
ncbi:hypothetical protein DAEQUDRAFT_338359 [Daedalea quercina L-15889]|uniref:RING-type E3 ubiquitin transferase n=1 Tax=Daedalea quercina L-15889 TaxID=1314783 RepID=A0A165PJT0_9APHY|nr:hypothetical protein DAEQUDRAFT_338359 [Daedalea quercina L-15889]